MTCFAHFMAKTKHQRSLSCFPLRAPPGASGHLLAPPGASGRYRATVGGVPEGERKKRKCVYGILPTVVGGIKELPGCFLRQDNTQLRHRMDEKP